MGQMGQFLRFCLHLTPMRQKKCKAKPTAFCNASILLKRYVLENTIRFFTNLCFKCLSMRRVNKMFVMLVKSIRMWLSLNVLCQCLHSCVENENLVLIIKSLFSPGETCVMKRATSALLFVCYVI